MTIIEYDPAMCFGDALCENELCPTHGTAGLPTDEQVERLREECRVTDDGEGYTLCCLALLNEPGARERVAEILDGRDDD